MKKVFLCLFVSLVCLASGCTVYRNQWVKFSPPGPEYLAATPVGQVEFRGDMEFYTQRKNLP